MNSEKIYAMPFDRVYRCLVRKAERKGRTQEEVNQIITWLCGCREEEIQQCIRDGITYGDFFRQAHMNPDRKKITGKICGIQVETIEDPLMQDIRYLDKLVDELAKGKTMDQILRK
jgi:hypothetical protein